METELNGTNEKFVPGQHYKFDPPIETNCISVGNSKLQRKKFPEGWCLKFEPEQNAFVFQGKPIGEGIEHYFLVERGKGSAARNVPSPYLRMVR